MARRGGGGHAPDQHQPHKRQHQTAGEADEVFRPQHRKRVVVHRTGRSTQAIRQAAKGQERDYQADQAERNLHHGDDADEGGEVPPIEADGAIQQFA